MPASVNIEERASFLKKLSSHRHDRVSPCFMTGKGCVYGDRIQEALDTRSRLARPDEPAWRGFVIMPFRPNLTVFLENCLRPFFHENYGCPETDPAHHGSRVEPPRCLLERGDEVSRPGIVVCEGICRRIQESDFVLADVSVGNSNVFYELGLAYGMRQNIIVVHQRSAEFAKHCMMTHFAGSGCSAFIYDDLDLIEAENFRVSAHIWRDSSRDLGTVEHTWQHPDKDRPESKPEPQIRLFESMLPDGELERSAAARSDDQDIRLLFRAHVKSHVGLAMDRIYNELSPKEGGPLSALQEYRDSIIKKYLCEADEIKPKESFPAIRQAIDRAYCLIVRTGPSCHPISYFWLGYAHARGKNVIPITVLGPLARKDGPRPPEASPAPAPAETARSAEDGRGWETGDVRDRIVDLAFDIRAQRHMIFDPDRPVLLERQVEQTLREMISSDFAAWSRKRFWEKMLGRSREVSILTGGLHSTEHNREMIGDWDLRAASELTSYFSLHQYDTKIETPVYQPEFALKFGQIPVDEFIKRVPAEIRLASKTCIIIASPDVNPLTEIALGKLYGVPESAWFKDVPASQSSADAIVAWKVRKKQAAEAAGSRDHPANRESAVRAFFQEKAGEKDFEERGFRTNWTGEGQRDQLKLKPYVSQNEAQHRPFTVYAHLVIAQNPFSPPDQAAGTPGKGLAEARQPRYVIILNGVSGPATFALTHVLTGGGNKEFVSYGRDFDPAAESERILNEILAVLNSSTKYTGVECIVEVEVGPSQEDAPGRSGATFDWRRILRWKLASNLLGKNIKVKPWVAPVA